MSVARAGLSDHLVAFTRPVTGSFAFVPSLETLAAICWYDREIASNS